MMPVLSRERSNQVIMTLACDKTRHLVTPVLFGMDKIAMPEKYDDEDNLKIVLTFGRFHIGCLVNRPSEAQIKIPARSW